MMSAVSAPFTPIQKWDDARPFAGKIVAVKAEGYYFLHTHFKENDTDSAYTLANCKWSFAHVRSTPITYFQGGIGYHLNILLKTNEVEAATIVNEVTLKQFGPLALRIATNEELKEIRGAVLSGRAIFAEAFCENSNVDARKILANTV